MPRKTVSKTEPPAKKKTARPKSSATKHKMARAAAAGQVSDQSLPYEEIERQAYFYWVERGYAHGDPTADWLRAEEELRQRYLRSTANTRP